MPQQHYTYLYGPVFSWRLGMSLGIDPLSAQEKICSFDCLYCQVGKTQALIDERKEFVPTQAIIDEIKTLPDIHIDYLTFSGNGEPTLAKNIGTLIAELKKIRKEKVAVITNATLLHRSDVQEDLAAADYVLAKLDACSQETLERVNQPVPSIDFKKITDGIASFRGRYRGKFALQIMFVDANKKYAPDIAAIAKKINPDEVQLNTPLRPSAAAPLSEQELGKIKKYFDGLPVVTVYDAQRKTVKPLNKQDTKKRRGAVFS